MTRLLAALTLLAVVAVCALSACATVEDQECRTLSSILDDSSYYVICLQQKAAAQ